MCLITFTTSPPRLFQCDYLQRPVKPLSHLSLPQCCRTKPMKLSLKSPPDPPPPLLMTAPLLWWKSHDVYGSLLLDGFQIPPSPSLFHFSLSLTLCVCQWLMRWTKLVRWMRGQRRVGWSVFMGWNDKISEVRVCECVVFLCEWCYSRSDSLIRPHI